MTTKLTLKAENLLDMAAAPKRKTEWSSLAIGAAVQIGQCTTLGQPLEVVKTHMAANRKDTIRDSIRKTWARGGISGFYQGLIPWAWLEASTKGSILILASTETAYYAKTYLGASSGLAGTLGGVVGGAAQAYLTIGFTNTMKTVEITRPKNVHSGVRDASTISRFVGILRSKGIRGIYRGVNAVALRQITNWSSRIGISRFAENQIRGLKGKAESDKLSFFDKILASTIGGALSSWNQPFEVIRVEMQSLTKDHTRPDKMTLVSTAKHIVKTSGSLGLFRGFVPRVAVGIWSTVCMVGFSDMAKDAFAFTRTGSESKTLLL